MMKKLFACAAAALILSLCVHAGDLPEVMVGTNAEFRPFEFTDENNAIVGFDVDVINAVGRAAGFKPVMRNQAFDTLIEGLESGKLDAAISGMTITDARRQKIDFSEPYYNSAQVIVVLEGTPALADMASLKDKLVGVQLGTTGAGMAEETLGRDNPNLKQFRRYNEVFSDLKLGRIDAVVVDWPVARAYVSKMGGMSISSKPMSEEQYGIAVKKGNAELLGKINEGLKKIRESGEFDRITEKWF